MRKLMLVGLMLVCSCGCAYLGYVKDPFVDIPVFTRVDSRIYRGGRLKAKGWEQLSAAGIKSIISLQGASPKVSREERLALERGMRFYHLPMTVFKQPTQEQAVRFLEIVLDKANQPVFVHCDSGRDRTGAMIAFYRVVVDGWTIKRAYHEARQFGFFPYHGDEAELKMFIHQLKDKQVYFEKAQELLAAENR
ncbi:MAG TPA: tyrosine-protein phosphatase [Candidatus Omnitrophota bacterium]|nr:tyrosine-protein phosphatase [Candidatus Omnitrophota bacterium]HRZ15140.1 tyrosine-protein phosphatase [Candidatus Omnitrophota bacterium]